MLSGFSRRSPPPEVSGGGLLFAWFRWMPALQARFRNPTYGAR